MICKGVVRGNGVQLAGYILDIEPSGPKNEATETIEVRGFDIGDLRRCFRQAEENAKALHPQARPFYHGQIAPPDGESFTREQVLEAADILERKQGFQGLDRIIQAHLKKGEWHYHVVWFRLDPESHDLRPLSFNKRNCHAAAGEIEERFDLRRLDRDDRMDQSRRFSPAETNQDGRATKRRAERTAEITALWEAADSGQALQTALSEAGYTLARGRRGFVVVDAAGEVHSLARQIKGAKKADVDARLSDLDPAWIPEADTITAGMKQARADVAREARQARKDGRGADGAAEAADGFQPPQTGPFPAVSPARPAEGEPPAEAMDAAAVLAALTRNHSTFTRDDLAKLVNGVTGGGGREPWMVQTGGFEALDDGQKASAERSYATWQETSPEAAARHGLADYVAYTQERQAERDDEQPGLREARAESRAAFVTLLAEVEALPDCIALGLDRTGKEGRFTSRTMLDTELRMADTAAALDAHARHAVKDTHQAAALRDAAEKGQALGDEQRQAFDHITQAGDLKLVVGFAGTGKSTMLGVVRQAAEASGYRVRGTAISGIAADSLEKGAGIHSRTLHSLLHQLDQVETRGAEVQALTGQIAGINGNSVKAKRFRADLEKKRDRAAADLDAARLTSRDILVVDEAGMIGSRQMDRLLGEAQKAGAKVVLVGDAEQLQSIEAGGAFRALHDRHGAAEITEIRRQREDWQRDATRDLATGRTAKALASYEAAGMVHQADTRDQAKAELVSAWSAARGASPAASQIILAYTRADVADLNAQARAAYRAEGRLGQDHALATEAGSQDFAAGDRLYFLKNDTRLGVKNGTLGTVDGIEAGRVSVRLDGPPDEAARIVSFTMQDYGHIAHGYAATVHKSQGVTVDRAHVLASRYMDRHAAYVGMSRHRDRADLYYGADELKDSAGLAKRLGRDAGKDTTLDYVARAEQGQGHTTGLRAAVAEFWQAVKDTFRRPAWLDQANDAPAEREQDRERGKGKERGTTDRAPSMAQAMKAAADARQKLIARTGKKDEPAPRPSASFAEMVDKMPPAQRAVYDRQQAQNLAAAEKLRQELGDGRRPDGPKHRI